jgi:hypothetical protein
MKTQNGLIYVTITSKWEVRFGVLFLALSFILVKELYNYNLKKNALTWYAAFVSIWTSRPRAATHVTRTSFLVALVAQFPAGVALAM